MMRKFLDIIDRLFIRLNTLANKSSFYKWGQSSTLGRHSKLIGVRNISVGSNVVISESAWLNANTDIKELPSLEIGDGTYIGRMTQINAWQDVKIGKKVLIADRVYISDADHNYFNKDLAIIDQNDRFVDRVKIEDGSWLCIGCVILPGVNIGKNAIVTANSVVVKDVPDFSIASGNPAKIIKNY